MAAAIDHQELKGQLAALSAVPLDEIRSDTRLVEDLNLDSLALLELIAWMVEKAGVAGLAPRLTSRDWAGTTVAEVERMV